MLGEVLSLGCAAVWGLSVVLFKQSDAVSPKGINLFKNTMGTLLLGLSLLVTGGGITEARSTEDWLRLVASGVIGLAVADTLFLDALHRLGAGMVAILDCAYAPLVVLFSVVLLDESLGLSFLIGAPLVVGGVVAASLDWGAVRAAARQSRDRVGAIVVGLASIAFMALGIVIAKPALAGGSVLELTFIRLLAGSVSLGAFVAVRPDRAEVLSTFRPQPVWKRLVPAAFLGTYVAMLFWIGGMKYTSASISAVLNQLSVLFTLVLARVVLGEPLTARRMWGGGASLVGSLIIILR